MLASSFVDDVKSKYVVPSYALPVYLLKYVYTGTDPLALSDRETMPCKIWDFADTMSYVPIFGVFGIMGVFAVSPLIYGVDFLRNRMSSRTNVAFTYELTHPPASDLAILKNSLKNWYTFF
jgi:hypothetical protein